MSIDFGQSGDPNMPDNACSGIQTSFSAIVKARLAARVAVTSA